MILSHLLLCLDVELWHDVTSLNIANSKRWPTVVTKRRQRCMATAEASVLRAVHIPSKLHLAKPNNQIWPVHSTFYLLLFCVTSCYPCWEKRNLCVKDLNWLNQERSLSNKSWNESKVCLWREIMIYSCCKFVLKNLPSFWKWHRSTFLKMQVSRGIVILLRIDLPLF